MAKFPYEIASRGMTGLPETLLKALTQAGLDSPFHWSGPINVVEKRPKIAMIGSRRPGKESTAAMEALAIQLATAGATIVSGAARGTDMAAHRGALNCGGTTIACLPQGITTLDPAAWRQEFRDLSGSELLLLLSPFSPEQPLNRQTPIVRNRLIAALAEVVIAGEAGIDSGTQWCLSNAFDYAVPVFLMESMDRKDERLAVLHRSMEKRGAVVFRPDDAYDPALANEILKRANEHHDSVRRAEESQLRLFD